MAVNQYLVTGESYLRMEENFTNSIPSGFRLHWTGGSGIGSVRGTDENTQNICYAKPCNFSIRIRNLTLYLKTLKDLKGLKGFDS